MKFKNRTDVIGAYRELLIADKDGDTLRVESDTKHVFIGCSDAAGVKITRAKALKLAFSIIEELNPGIM